MENGSATAGDAGAVRKAKRATLLIFLVCGIGVATWAPMVPLTKQRMSLNEADLGLILLLLGAGAIITMPFVGFFITRIGNKPVMLSASLVLALMLPVLTLIDTPVLMGAALFVFGAGVGSLDVAMNAHAVVVQNRVGHPVMSTFHALFSVGGLLGSIGLGVLMLPGWSPTVAASVISVAIAVIALFQYRHLLPLEAEKGKRQSFRFPKGMILLLGLFCFIAFLTEGALLDWSGIFLRADRGFGPAMAGSGYAVFSVAMAIMRFSGDGLVQKFGAKKIVFSGSILAAFGLLLAVVVEGPFAALAGFLLIGFGAANIVPVLFSAAGNAKGYAPGLALSAVTTLGYAGQLAGPALIGFLAYFLTLPFTLGALALPMVFVGICFRKMNT